MVSRFHDKVVRGLAASLSHEAFEELYYYFRNRMVIDSEGNEDLDMHAAMAVVMAHRDPYFANGICSEFLSEHDRDEQYYSGRMLFIEERSFSHAARITESVRSLISVPQFTQDAIKRIGYMREYDYQREYGVSWDGPVIEVGADIEPTSVKASRREWR